MSAAIKPSHTGESDWAHELAHAVGGEAWHMGGNTWLVVLRKRNGHLIAFSDDMIGEYADEDALEYGDAVAIIELDGRASS